MTTVYLYTLTKALTKWLRTAVQLNKKNVSGDYAGAVLALARWGNGGTIPAEGTGATIYSWIKDITGLFKWKSREAGPKWGGALGRSTFFIGGGPLTPRRTAPATTQAHLFD